MVTGAQNASSIVEAAPESQPTKIILSKSNFADVNESCSDESSSIIKDFADFLKKYSPGDAERIAPDQSASELCSPRFADLLRKYDSVKPDEGSPLYCSTPSPRQSKRPVKLEFEDFLRKLIVDTISPETSSEESAPSNVLSAQTLESSKQLEPEEISCEVISETVEASTTERSNSESALQESKPDQSCVKYDFKDFLTEQALSPHSSKMPEFRKLAQKQSPLKSLTIDTTPPSTPEKSAKKHMSPRVSPKQNVQDIVRENSPRTSDKNTEQINLESVVIHSESIDLADIKPETPEIAAKSEMTPLSVKQKLENLLCQRAPDKLQNIPSLLDKFAGREAELLAKVEAKYGHNQDLGKKEGTVKDQQDPKIEVPASPSSKSQLKTPVAKFAEKNNFKKKNAQQNLGNEKLVSPKGKSQPKTPVAKFAEKNNSKRKNAQHNLSNEKLVLPKGKKKPKTPVTRLAEKNNNKKKNAHRNAKKKKAQRNLIIDKIPRRKMSKSHSEQSKKENTQRLQLTISLSENLREKIRAVFHEHAPDKLQTLPPLLQKFQGNEAVLLSKMKEKYEPVKAPENTAESSASKPRTKSRIRTRKDQEMRAAELCDKEAALLAKLTTKRSRRTRSRMKSRGGSALNFIYPRSKSLPPRISPTKAEEDDVNRGDEVAVIEQNTTSACSMTARRQRERQYGRQKRKHASKHKQGRQKPTTPQHKHASRDRRHQSENKRLIQQSKQKQRTLHAKPSGNSLPLSQAEQEIRKIFKAHAPDKLSNISKLMLKFRGKEQVLLTKIKKKYGLLST